jgi:hypothetical protein
MGKLRTTMRELRRWHAAAPTPLVEDIAIDEADGGELRSLLDFPGEPKHASLTNPLHHPLAALNLGSDRSVLALKPGTPLVELIRGHRSGQHDDAGGTVDRRHQQVHRRAEGRVAQDGAALVDPRIGLGPITAQAISTELTEPGIKLRERRPGPKSEEFERSGECLRRRPGVSQEEERYGEAKRLAREDQTFRTLAA